MGNLLCREKSPRRVYIKGGAASTYNPQLFATDSMINGTRKSQESDGENDVNHM